jgi:predicted phosphatase
MQIRRSELPAYFDVDETLILKSPVRTEEFNVPLNYHGSTKYAKPINQHVEFLKACFARGYEITVWSANGFDWATTVVKALNLEQYVSFVCTKPQFYCDDKKADEWMKHIFISESR